jgi:hypothetical protein
LGEHDLFIDAKDNDQMATGHQNVSARILTYAVVLKLALNFILIPKYQATGAAMATAIMTVFWNALLRYEDALPPRTLFAANPPKRPKLQGLRLALF